MKNIFYILLILLTFGITSCNSDDGPAAIPKKELQNALDLLAQGKMEQYMSKLDFGEELAILFPRPDGNVFAVTTTTVRNPRSKK